MGSPSVPTVEDPNQVAASQNTYNIGAAAGAQASSNYNQSNPYGSVNFSQTGTGPNGMPTYTASQTLSPTEQGIFNNLQGGQTAASAGSASLASGYGGAPNIMGDANSATGQMMANQVSFLQPYFKDQTSQLDTQLRNQGILPGTPAYDQQMRAVQQNQNGSVSQFLASAQPQAFNEAVTNYELPLQTASALQQYATSPAAIAPNAAAVAGAANTLQPPNLEGAVASANTANMAAYQAQMAQQGSIFGGLAGVAGKVGAAAITACDRELKEDFKDLDGEEVLRKIADLPIVDFAYKEHARLEHGLPRRRTFCMAQDWQATFGGDGNGKTIDLGDVLGKVLVAIQVLEKRTRKPEKRARRPK